MGKNLKKNQFITLLFEHESAREAYDFFNEHQEFIGKISLPECIELLYRRELCFEKGWRQLDEFISPSKDINKLILRDLLDVGYIESCPDNITAKEVYKISFLLAELGMYCIVSEFFATACNFIPEMQVEWDKLKNDPEPNLRSYIEKFAERDVNLQFMKGLLHG